MSEIQYYTINWRECDEMEDENGIWAMREDIENIQAENDRLKTDLVDSLPLGKVKEIVNKTLSRDLSVYSGENPFSVCVRIALKDSLDEILSTLEAYVKEVQGE